MKYQKKPVVVEAIIWTGDNFMEVDAFITVPHETYPSKGFVIIETPEGRTKAMVGDYIVKGVKGEFYPCKPDIFQESHDPVGDDAQTTHEAKMAAERDADDWPFPQGHKPDPTHPENPRP